MKILLTDLEISLLSLIEIYYNNKYAINITHNLVHHDCTKYKEMDCHFMKEKLETDLISIPYISTQNQSTYLLAKGVSST